MCSLNTGELVQRLIPKDAVIVGHAFQFAHSLSSLLALPLPRLCPPNSLAFRHLFTPSLLHFLLPGLPIISSYWRILNSEIRESENMGGEPSDDGALRCEPV